MVDINKYFEFFFLYIDYINYSSEGKEIIKRTGLNLSQ